MYRSNIFVSKIFPIVPITIIYLFVSSLARRMAMCSAEAGLGSRNWILRHSPLNYQTHLRRSSESGG